MSITEGSRLPDEVLNLSLYEGTTAVPVKDLVLGKKVLLFAVPGAFTPGCSKTHLPGYVQQADAIKAKGISEIICVSVNDGFVMQAWGKEHQADGKVRLLGDVDAKFTNALGLSFSAPIFGGARSKRYAAIINDGVVEVLQVEPDGTGLSCSLSNAILTRL